MRSLDDHTLKPLNPYLNQIRRCNSFSWCFQSWVQQSLLRDHILLQKIGRFNCLRNNISYSLCLCYWYKSIHCRTTTRLSWLWTYVQVLQKWWITFWKIKSWEIAQRIQLLRVSGQRTVPLLPTQIKKSTTSRQLCQAASSSTLLKGGCTQVIPWQLGWRSSLWIRTHLQSHPTKILLARNVPECCRLCTFMWSMSMCKEIHPKYSRTSCQHACHQTIQQNSHGYPWSCH